MKTTIPESEKHSLSLLKEKSKNLKILYVEDQNKVRVQTTKMLNIFFDDITQATNGKDALSIVKDSHFDVIFTDIKMPIMDGLQMIEQIRKKDKVIPIVVFSAYDDKEYLLKAIEYGIDGYCTKPFRFNTIHDLIEKIINKIYAYQKKEHIIYLIDDFSWHIETSFLYQNNQKISLTKHETMLFELLASSSNATFTSEEIEEELFDDLYTDNKRVRSLISRFKNKVEVSLIQSVYSQGYKLNLDVSC